MSLEWWIDTLCIQRNLNGVGLELPTTAFNTTTQPPSPQPGQVAFYVQQQVVEAACDAPEPGKDHWKVSPHSHHPSATPLRAQLPL